MLHTLVLCATIGEERSGMGGECLINWEVGCGCQREYKLGGAVLMHCNCDLHAYGHVLLVMSTFLSSLTSLFL